MTPDDRSLGELLQDILDQTRDLFRSEIRLAKAETRLELAKAGRGVALALAAILLAVFGLHFLLWTLVWALAPEMENWLATLIVAIGVFVFAGVFGAIGLRILKGIDATPRRAARQLEETVAWAKSEKRT